MNSATGTSQSVLRSFIAGANAQYRAAGLGAYQMRVERNGSVTTPNLPAPRFGNPPAAGASAGEQGRVGAAAAAGSPAPTGTAATPQPVRRTGTHPTISDLAPVGTDGFSLAWQPVAGATRYGIYQDGVLMGHVTSPRFAGALAAGSAGHLQVDAVRADGSRTQLTPVLQVARSADGKLSFDVPGARAGAPAAATAPAAAAR